MRKGQRELSDEPLINRYNFNLISNFLEHNSLFHRLMKKSVPLKYYVSFLWFSKLSVKVLYIHWYLHWYKLDKEFYHFLCRNLLLTSMLNT